MGRSVQIDVVGFGADGWVDICECRRADRGSIAGVAGELALRAARFPVGKRTVRQMLFLRNEHRRARAGVVVCSLRQLYASVSLRVTGRQARRTRRPH